MLRSRILFDRKIRSRRNDTDSVDGHTAVTKEKKLTKVITIDGNNNTNDSHISSINHTGLHRQHISISRLRMSNSNFDFIEPCDIAEELNNEVDSLDSLEIKNWRYHLTNNRF